MITYTNIPSYPLSEVILPINAFDIRLYNEKKISSFPPVRWPEYCLKWQLSSQQQQQSCVNPKQFQFLLNIIHTIIIYTDFQTKSFEQCVDLMLNDLDLPTSSKYYLKLLILNTIPHRQLIVVPTENLMKEKFFSCVDEILFLPLQSLPPSTTIV